MSYPLQNFSSLTLQRSCYRLTTFGVALMNNGSPGNSPAIISMKANGICRAVTTPMTDHVQLLGARGNRIAQLCLANGIIVGRYQYRDIFVTDDESWR